MVRSLLTSMVGVVLVRSLLIIMGGEGVSFVREMFQERKKMGLKEEKV